MNLLSYLLVCLLLLVICCSRLSMIHGTKNSANGYSLSRVLQQIEEQTSEEEQLTSNLTKDIEKNETQLAMDHSNNDNVDSEQMTSEHMINEGEENTVTEQNNPSEEPQLLSSTSQPVRRQNVARGRIPYRLRNKKWIRRRAKARMQAQSEKYSELESPQPQKTVLKKRNVTICVLTILLGYLIRMLVKERDYAETIDEIILHDRQIETPAEIDRKIELHRLFITRLELFRENCLQRLRPVLQRRQQISDNAVQGEFTIVQHQVTSIEDRTIRQHLDVKENNNSLTAVPNSTPITPRFLTN